MIRLLVINHVTARSGGEIALLRMIERLDKSCFDVVVALPDGTGMLPRALAAVPGVRLRVVPGANLLLSARRFDAWPLLHLPEMVLQFLGIIWRHARVIREERIDVVLTNSIKSDYYGSLAAVIARRRLVWYVHDLVDHRYFPAWASRTLAWFARLPEHILCNSSATAHALCALGIPRQKLSIAYPAVKSVDGGRADRAAVRCSLGLDSGAPIVTLTGRITKPKGQMQFVQSLESVRRRIPDVVYLIVGDSMFGSYDDEYRNRVAAAIAELPDPSCVRMLGERADALDIVAASDVVVFPSLWPEGFGLAVAEAMLLGIPIVATALGGTAELVEDGVTGLRITPNDPPALAEAVVRLLLRPDEAARLSAAARNRIEFLSSGDPGRIERVLLGMSAA